MFSVINLILHYIYVFCPKKYHYVQLHLLTAFFGSQTPKWHLKTKQRNLRKIKLRYSHYHANKFHLLQNLQKDGTENSQTALFSHYN